MAGLVESLVHFDILVLVGWNMVVKYSKVTNSVKGTTTLNDLAAFLCQCRPSAIWKDKIVIVSFSQPDTNISIGI
jgi:hypothetical protein